MANKEHLDILKKGVEVWNEWRKENPSILPDLSKANLSQSNLRLANFTKTDLTEANLYQAILTETNLSFATLKKVNFSNPPQKKIRFGSRMIKLRPSNPDWRHITYFNQDSRRGANLYRANLYKSDLSNAILNRTNLYRSNLSEANLCNTMLEGAYLKGTMVINANLSGASLDSAILSFANLTNANLSNATLRNAQVSSTKLNGANLQNTQLDNSNFQSVTFNSANMYNVGLSGANLWGADLSDTFLKYANLRNADLSKTNLTNANLTNANLNKANLVETNLDNSILKNCSIYGINVWDIKGKIKDQRDLVITQSFLPKITVDDIEVAQFIYLLLNNNKIRNVIGTIAQKGVLILGRFTLERKKILNAIREQLRQNDFVPMMFDFEKIESRDYTETVKTLAGMSRFVIVDVTHQSSCPLELQATVPDYKIPFIPLILKGERPFAMLIDLIRKFEWVSGVLEYESEKELIGKFQKEIIDEALNIEKTMKEKERQSYYRDNR